MPATAPTYLITDPGLAGVHRIRTFLVEEGVPPEAIQVAYTAEEALRRFRERSPAVVFLSLDLPDMGGAEVAEVLWNEAPDLDLVVTTARPGDDPHVLEVLELGAHSFLRKPVRRETVADLVATFGDESGDDARDEGDDRDRFDTHLTRIPPPA